MALEAVEGGLVPDILVTDYVMAHMNGAQLATELRQRWPGLPVLIVTGYTDLNAEQLSRFEVLNKPYRRVELAEHLIRLLPGGAKQAK
ncbi:MAG: response regulator [Hafnia sp.]